MTSVDQDVGRRLDIRAILDRIDRLPTIPLVADEIADLVENPRATAEAIAAVLRADQSLSAKVLKMANSAYYAIPGGVTDVKRAISFLGYNTLYQLVLSVSVLSVFDCGSSGPFDPQRLWQHSLGCAVLSELIARGLGISDASTCFSGGLLHDVGKVALLQVAPSAFTAAVELARSKGITVQEAERLCGMPSHDVVGKRLAERWRFPMALRVAISHPVYAGPAARAALPKNLTAYLDITALANALVRRAGFGDPGDDVAPEITPVMLERLNLTQSAVAGLVDNLWREVERTKVLLELASAP